jgi:hypothetical protein
MGNSNHSNHSNNNNNNNNLSNSSHSNSSATRYFIHKGNSLNRDSNNYSGSRSSK